MVVSTHFRKILVCLVLFISVGLSMAQRATIQRSSNLRESPSTNSQIAGTLGNGDTVTLTSTQKTSGYYQVKTSDGKAGWVWARNVKISGVISTTARVTNLQATGASTFTESCSAPAFPAEEAPIDSTSCGVEGSGGKEAAQNSEKNNFCAPGSARAVMIQDLVQLQQRVESDTGIPFGRAAGSRPAGPATDRGPLEALGEGSQVVLTGFVKRARQEGAESVNCGKNVPNQPAYHDIHIAIVGNPDDVECNGVVVEMIPHHRPDSWTPAFLSHVATSKLPVRVTGNLMFDSSHSPCRDGAALPGDPSRASLWEVHPIYKFEVCTQSDCSSGDGWIPLESWKAQ